MEARPAGSRNGSPAGQFTTTENEKGHEMANLMENGNLQSAFIPVDLQAAANNGDWVSLKLYNHVALVVFKAAGTAGDDPVITVTQATDVSGTSEKALTFDTIYSKVGTQTGIGTFTTNTQTAANTYTDATSAEAAAIFVVEFDAADLDVANGFDCVQLSVPDVGSNAQLGCAFYILTEPRYAEATPQSAITD